MSHPAEGTSKASKAAALKEKLAKAKGESGGNGQTAPAVPSNGSSGHAAPVKVAKKKGGKTPAKAAATKTPTKAPAKAPAKVAAAKTPAKAPKEKAPAKKEPTKRAAPQGERNRTMDRDKSGDGLRPIERDIMKVVKQRRGKPISIRDIAVALHGENKVKAADDGTTKDNVLVRTVRNGIRKPREYGMLKLWTETGDPEAKNGFVLLGDGTPPAGAATKAKKQAKAQAKGSDKPKKTPAKKSAKAPAPKAKTPAKKSGKGKSKK